MRIILPIKLVRGDVVGFLGTAPATRPARNTFGFSESDRSMQRRIRILPGADDRDAIARRSRRMLAACFIAIICILALLTLQQTSDDKAAAQERPRAAPCGHWDDMASEAISLLAQNKQDLSGLSEATFRMWRAQSNCRAGWLGPACEDYRAIIEQAPERKMLWATDSSACAAVLSERSRPLR